MRFNIKDDLRRCLHQKGLMQQLEATLVCRRGGEVISGILGPRKAAAGVRIEKYVRKTRTLEVVIRDSGCIQGLRTNNSQVIHKINGLLGEPCVERIRYRIE